MVHIMKLHKVHVIYFTVGSPLNLDSKTRFVFEAAHGLLIYSITIVNHMPRITATAGVLMSDYVPGVIPQTRL